eukprot:gene34425-biopygen29339
MVKASDPTDNGGSAVPEASGPQTDGGLEMNSPSSGTSHVSLTTSGTTYVSPTTSDTTHSTLAAVRDEDGPLLLVFFAHLKGRLVKVLVDSGASDNFVSEKCAERCGLVQRAGAQMRVTLADGSVKTTGSTAYAKFSANTTTGTYTENALALRVLPLGIQVDVVLGGKWLRSLSPVTLDYAGNGSIGFNRRSRS